MKNNMAAKGKRLAKKGLQTQLVVAFLVALVTGLFGSAHLAVSVSAGAFTSILPNLVFAVFAFKYSGARQNQLVARSFSQGSKLKLALTMILFVVAFKQFPENALPIMLGFAVATVSYMLALFWYGKKINVQSYSQ